MKVNIPRTHYLKKLCSYRSNPELIKVITGIRRSGKSVLMKQFMELLLEQGVSEKNLLYIDLERKRYVLDSERALYSYIKDNISAPNPYVLIDEVQLVRGWERALDTIRLEFDANIYVTGSNSETVSSELGTHLTGRYVEIGILPFSFKEFIERYPLNDDNGYTQRLEQYLHHGGMPIIDLDDDEEKNLAILQGVYSSIINKDIRPNLEMNQGTLDNLTAFMLSNIGNLVSAGNIKNGAHIRDPRTLEKYLSKLCDCFIFYRADNYDIIGKKHLQTKSKYYVADTGLRNAILCKQEHNEAALLENAVYLELIRRGYRVNIGSYKDHEVDFTAWKPNSEPEFYQISLELDKESTVKRELNVFKTLPSSKKYIITMGKDVPRSLPEGTEVVDAVEFFLSS
ncbi:MAG: ATP-binding protein [archaeon]|nr:ATP-binding protein [archaeon]